MSFFRYPFSRFAAFFERGFSGKIRNDRETSLDRPNKVISWSPREEMPLPLRVESSMTDDVIRAARNPDTSAVAIDSVSLGASVELAIWEFHNESEDRCIKGWKDRHSLLEQSMNLVKHGVVQRIRPFEERSSEFFPVDDTTDFSGLLWGQFLSRFTSAIRQTGLRNVAQGFSGILHDLADNVSQHSKIGCPDRSIHGVTAYAVENRKISFVVGDDGVGALGSLKTNTDWARLKSDKEAIYAIACDHASRRRGQGDGQGYKNLFAVLARMNGLVRLRSGTGIFELRGALDKLKPIGSVGPFIPGVQLTVECEF